MGKNKYLALSALGFFLSGCTGTGLTKNQAALLGVVGCGAVGAGVGVGIGHTTHHRENEGAVAAIGAVIGVLLCGALAYLTIEEPKPSPPPPPTRPPRPPPPPPTPPPPSPPPPPRPPPPP